MTRILACLLTLSLATAATAAAPIPRPPAIEARSYLLIDYDSGQALAELNADERVEPASITKVMTVYAALDLMRQKKIGGDTAVPISEKAWRQGKDSTESRMFLEVGKTARLDDLLRGIIIQSGNDAAVAVAEFFGGSEDGFAEIMNHYAARLGLKGTHYADASGLPSPQHYTTARDIATLSVALIRDFPEQYKIFAEKEFTYHGIRQQNRNGLLWRDASIDGIKTGHTASAGYCLAASAKRGDMRLISVVMRTASTRAREAANATLLNHGFTFYQSVAVKKAGELVLKPRVYKGSESEIAIGPRSAVHVTVPRDQIAGITTTATVQRPLIAPLAVDRAVGELQVKLGDRVIGRAPLYPQSAVPEAGFFGRLYDSVMLWFD